MLSMLSINRENRLDSVEKMEAGEKVDSSERQQILRLSVSRRKESGDVAQLVRALPCHGRGRGFEPRRPRHETLQRAARLGADHGINYRNDPDWHKRVLELTSGRGADVVLDVAGSATLTRCP